MTSFLSPHILALQKALSRQLATMWDRLFELQFQELELHRQFVDEHFSKQGAKFRSEFEKVTADMRQDDLDEYAEWVQDEADMLFEILPALQYQAQFLVVYATFEYNLNMLCDVVTRRLKIATTFRETKGQGCERAKDFLVKDGGVTGVFDGNDWNRAMLFGKIRNQVAHADGRVNSRLPKHAPVLQAAKQLGIRLKPVADGADEFYLILSSTIVREAIGTLQAVLHSVATFERDWPDSP